MLKLFIYKYSFLFYSTENRTENTAKNFLKNWKIFVSFCFFCVYIYANTERSENRTETAERLNRTERSEHRKAKRKRNTAKQNSRANKRKRKAKRKTAVKPQAETQTAKANGKLNHNGLARTVSHCVVMKKWTKEQRTQVTLDSKSVAGARELGSRFEIVKIPGGLTLPAPKCGLQNGQGMTKFAVRFAWQRNGAFVPTEQNITPRLNCSSYGATILSEIVQSKCVTEL